MEDDEVVATFVVELLGRLGDVRWLTSAEQAAELVGRRDWDLIISDIELPGANGLEFIARVDARSPSWPTLILSGHSSFDHAVAALRAGADDYLTKPIEPGALIEKAAR